MSGMVFIVHDTLIDAPRGRTLTGRVDIGAMTTEERAIWMPLVERSLAQGMAHPEGVRLDVPIIDTSVVLPGADGPVVEHLDAPTRRTRR